MHPIIKLAGNIALSNISDLRRPYKMIYALTYRCQCKCIMCNIWNKEPREEMTLEQISDFFKRSNEFSWINLTGGEIFLRADLLDVVDSIKKNCKGLYLLNFPTNGYQTEVIVGTLKKILNLFRFPRVIVTVSLDGPPQLHDRIRNLSGCWEKAVETYEGLRRLRSSHFDVYFGMTLQSANANAFEETIRAADGRIGNVRFNDCHINVVHSSTHYYGNSDEGAGYDKQMIREHLGKIQNVRRRSLLDSVNYLERRYQKMASDYLAKNRSPVRCQALSASFFMDAEGMVYPCSIFDRPVGNIRNFGYSLSHLWNSDQRGSIRKEICKGNCPHCWSPCEAYQSILANLLHYT